MYISNIIKFNDGKIKLNKLIDDYIYNNDKMSSMKSYTLVYNMCIQKPPYNYCIELYEFIKTKLIELIEDRYLNTDNYLNDSKYQKYLKFIYCKDISEKLKCTFIYLDSFYTKINLLHPINPNNYNIMNISYEKGISPPNSVFEFAFMKKYKTDFKELDTLEKEIIKKYKIKQFVTIFKIPILNNNTDVLRLICEYVSEFEIDKKNMLRVLREIL